MKRIAFSIVMFVAALACLSLGLAVPGCTATGGFLGTGIGATSQPITPTIQLANLEDQYTTAVNAVVALRTAGTFKAGSTFDTDFKVGANAAYAALKNMRLSVAAGLGVQQTDLNAFTAALEEVATAKSNGVNATVAP